MFTPLARQCWKSLPLGEVIECDRMPCRSSATTTNGERPSVKSIGKNLLFAAGTVLLLVGVCPMAFALSVANHVMDNGLNEGGNLLMEKWEAWAFSPPFITAALLGGTILSISFFRCSRDVRAAYAKHVLPWIGVAMFIAAILPDWVLF